MENVHLNLEIELFKQNNSWHVHFNDREIAEILFAIKYVLQFGHGTSGHLGYTVIEKLVEVLEEK
jgi:hypothetical protein